MLKRALLCAALTTGFMLEGGCSGNHTLLFGALGLGALLLLRNGLPSTTTTT